MAGTLFKVGSFSIGWDSKVPDVDRLGVMVEDPFSESQS